MRALDGLRHFIKAMQADGTPEEVRSYANENAEAIAEELGMTAGVFRGGVASVDDDATMARRLLAQLDRLRREGRDDNVATRAFEAQVAADAIGRAVIWEGGRAHVDLVSLLTSALTRRDDVLTFRTDTFAMSIRMAPLFSLRSLKRGNLSAWVDSEGMHVRWPTGGLNLRSLPRPEGSQTVVNLASCASARAA